MKKYKVLFSEEAKKDLKNIYTYILENFSREEADAVVLKIAERVKMLDIFPERTEPFDKNKDGRPVRVTISGKYRVIYLVDKENKEVLIARIFSVSQKVIL